MSLRFPLHRRQETTGVIIIRREPYYFFCFSQSVADTNAHSDSHIHTTIKYIEGIHYMCI